MKELSLHILDIAENSIKANASLVEIVISEDIKKNILSIDIIDNGSGMSEEFLKRVKDPFSTTRTTRKVGMGISLFESAAVQCGGSLDISSKEGVGTKVHTTFRYDSIDRAPIGDMAGTMQTLISGSPKTDFLYRHIAGEKEFTLDTRQVRKMLEGVPIDTPEVVLWINDFIKEGLNEIYI